MFKKVCVSIGEYADLLCIPAEMVADAPPESFVGDCLEYLDGKNLFSGIYKMRKTRKKVRFAKKLTKIHYIRKSYYKRGGGTRRKRTKRRKRRRKSRRRRQRGGTAQIHTGHDDDNKPSWCSTTLGGQ